jgi:hypothetical protein
MSQMGLRVRVLAVLERSHMNIPKPTAGEGKIVEIEDGFYPALFRGIEPREHPNWAVEKDQFGNPDDGNRMHFLFRILDEDWQPAIPANADEPDETIDLDAMTRNLSSDSRSNAYELLKGILTPPQFAQWEAGDEIDSPDDPVVMVRVEHNKKNYPFVAATLGLAPKPKKAVK